MKYADAFLLSSQGRNRVESKTERQLKPKNPPKAGFSHKKNKGEEGTKGEGKKVIHDLIRGALNTQQDNTGSGGTVGAIRGWGMGKARGEKAALAVGGVCLGLVFFSLPLAHPS